MRQFNFKLNLVALACFALLAFVVHIEWNKLQNEFLEVDSNYWKCVKNQIDVIKGCEELRNARNREDSFCPPAMKICDGKGEGIALEDLKREIKVTGILWTIFSVLSFASLTILVLFCSLVLVKRLVNKWNNGPGSTN